MSRDQRKISSLDHRRIPPREAHSYTKMPAPAGVPLSPAVASAQLRGAPPTFTPFSSQLPCQCCAARPSGPLAYAMLYPKQGEPPGAWWALPEWGTSSEAGIPMATCETCGNSYDKSFQIIMASLAGRAHGRAHGGARRTAISQNEHYVNPRIQRGCTMGWSLREAGLSDSV
jgi:hypothetical protein